MVYQKIISLLNDTINQPSEFRTRNWVEINDESRGTYNVSNQIKFKISMIRSSLCDYSDVYIHVKGTITSPKHWSGSNKKVTLKNCAPFTNCISQINNTQVDDTHDINVVMPIYNLLEYSYNYSKTSRSL